MVAVGMVSWAVIGDHRWKEDALLETSVFWQFVFWIFWLARVMISGLSQVLSVWFWFESITR
jgi:hypothetical protein